MARHVGELVDGAIRLESEQVSDEQVRKFRELFDAAWTRVMSDHQGLVARYWRQCVAPEDCRQKVNVNERYDPHVLFYAESAFDLKASPRAMLDGHVLLFPAKFLETLGDSLAIVAIAHELAHVTFHAESEPNHWPDTRNPAIYNAAERLVDARLLAWGFQRESLEALDACLVKKGISRWMTVLV
jgi:hypothetical protein